MTKTRDTELAEELEVIVGAKTREQQRMFAWFAASFALFILTGVFHHAWLIALTLLALALGAIAQGLRHHLRAAALRGQAMEKILTEAFRRAGQEPPESTS